MGAASEAERTRLDQGNVCHVCPCLDHHSHSHNKFPRVGVLYMSYLATGHYQIDPARFPGPVEA